MEAPKNLPFSGFHRMVGNLFIPLMGCFLIATLALKYSRSSQDNLVTLLALSVAVSVLTVSIAYVKFRRVLGRAQDSISENNLAALTGTANTMVIVGYLACMTAMIFVANGAHR